MHSTVLRPLPRETVRAAEAIFGKGNVYVVIGDQIDSLLAGINLVGLDASGEKPADSLAILALVTLFQFAERLPDRRAAEAARLRTDWKYALHLPSSYLGLDHWALCQFRQGLWIDPAARLIFEQLQDRVAGTGLLGRDRPPSDSRQNLMQVCALSRLERLADAMRMTLEALVSRAPEWLRTTILPHWYQRYDRAFSASFLPHTQERQEDLARAIGMDARHLLDTIGQQPAALAMLPEVQGLTQEWQRQFEQSAHEIRWRLPLCADC